jgi:gamma-glutamylcyclotransferase (GGCT)/AIG2-like uncharacterized protein YtfP
MLLLAIQWRVGHVKKIGTMTLHKYKLVFNTGADVAYANVIAGEKGDKVEGVLYDLDDEQIGKLDWCEGYPVNYQKKYFSNEEGHIVYMYVSSAKGHLRNPRLPDRSYIIDLYNGAKENGLEDTRLFLKDYLANVLKQPLISKKIK